MQIIVYARSLTSFCLKKISSLEMNYLDSWVPVSKSCGSLVYALRGYSCTFCLLSVSQRQSSKSRIVPHLCNEWRWTAYHDSRIVFWSQCSSRRAWLEIDFSVFQKHLYGQGMFPAEFGWSYFSKYEHPYFGNGSDCPGYHTHSLGIHQMAVFDIEQYGAQYSATG